MPHDKTGHITGTDCNVFHLGGSQTLALEQPRMLHGKLVGQFYLVSRM